VIAGLCGFVLANVAAVVLAQALLARCRTGDRGLDFVIFLILRLAVMSAAILGATAAGILTPAGVAIPLGVAAVGAMALRLPREPHPWRLEGWTALDTALAALVGTRLLAQVWFFSPHLGDALAYHLPKVGEWVRAGGFTPELGLHPHGSFPAGFELLETWWIVFLRHDLLIEAAGVEFLVLGFAACRALARRAGLTPRESSPAAFAFLLAPGFHLSATSCLNDAPAAAMVVALFALVAARAPVPLLALAAGMGLGIKPTVGFAFPGLALLAFLQRREPAGRDPLGAPTAALLGAGGLILGSFWYGRNLLRFGNPFHPLGSPDVDNPVAVQLGPRFPSLLKNVSDLVETRIYDNRGAYGANVDDIAGWGASAFCLGAVALLVLVREDLRIRRLAVAFAASLLASLLFVQNDPWCLKYVFYAPALPAVAAARLASTSTGLRWIQGAAIAFSFVGTLLPYDLPRASAAALASQGWRERSALEFPPSELPEDAVACFGAVQTRSYLLYRPDFSRRVVYLRSATADALIDDLNAAGRIPLVAEAGTARQLAVLQEALRSRRLVPRGRAVYVLADESPD
jgi:hypothetical protein